MIVCVVFTNVLYVTTFKMSKVLLFFCAVSSIHIMDTARILAVFPTPSISHQTVFRVLTQELVKRGHEVVVITTDPAFSKDNVPANLTEIDVHDVSYGYLHKVFAEQMSDYEYGMETDGISIQKELHLFFKVLEAQFKSKGVQKLIQQKEVFDVLLIEAYMRPAIAFSHVFKAPVILVSSFGATLENLDSMGASTHPLLYPTPFRQRLYNLSLWNKFREYFNYLQYLHFQKEMNRLDDEFLQGTFGSSIPSIDDLAKNIDMLFLNVHPIWMDNQPMPPGVVFMGGLHQKPPMELPMDLKSFLDSSKNGVLYVSFGTNVQPMLFPPERLKVITDALSELPYDVLFKWNDDELPGRTENIKTSKWFPQSDLLSHPNIKAFVMQGGLQSTDEAITAGVPLVCIPMVGDQWYNAEKYARLKIGIHLEFLTLTKAQLKDAIETVISEKSYRENIMKLRERMHDQPQTSLERAIWWIEYVLRHGGARHLRAPAANMSWAEYYELELVLIVITIFFITLITSLYAIKLLWRYISQFICRNVKVKRS